MHGKLYWKCLLVTKEVAMYLAGSRGCVLERGLVLSLTRPENMESGTLHYSPGPTKLAIPSPLLLGHLYPDSCKLERPV